MSFHKSIEGTHPQIDIINPIFSLDILDNKNQYSNLSWIRTKDLKLLLIKILQTILINSEDFVESTAFWLLLV